MGPSPVHASSSLVQQQSVLCIRAGGNPTCGPTLSASFPSYVASGNVIVAAVLSGDNVENPVTSIVDSRGSTFTQAVASYHSFNYVYIFYATLSSSGADTVTITFSSTPDYYAGAAYLFIYEVRGVTTTSVATGTGFGSSGSVSASSTAFRSRAFLVAIMANGYLSSSWGAGSGFQFTPTPNGDEFIQLSKAEYSTSGVASPTNFPATLSAGSQDWVEVGAAFNSPATAGTSVTIPLVSGWNLISLPIVPNSTAISAGQLKNPAYSNFFAGPANSVNNMFNSTGLGYVTSVWTYNGKTWLFCFVSGGSCKGTLTTMVDGFGYWVYATSPNVVLTFGGWVIQTLSTPPTYALVKGWNLVGFKPQPDPTVSGQVSTYLTSISGKYDMNNVWLYDNSSGAWIRTVGSTPILPGQALWVLMTTPATLRP